MPFEKMQCDNCGGFLQIDSSGMNAVCLSCGTPYIKKDNTFVVNNYIIVDEQSSQARLKAGHDNLRIKRYDYALQDFMDVCKIAPGDYRGWWGLIRTCTHDFTKRDLTSSQFTKLKGYFNNMEYFTPVDLRPEFYKQFTSYYEPLYKAHIEEKNHLSQTISSTDSKIKKAQRELEELEAVHFDPLKPFSIGFSEFLWGCLGWGFVIMVAVYFIEGLRHGIVPVIGIALIVAPIALFLVYYIIIRPIPNMIIHFCQERNYSKRDALRVRLNDLHQQKSVDTTRLTRISR